MPLHERIALAIFVALVGGVYLATAAMLIHVIRRKLKREARPLSRAARVAFVTLLALSAAGLVCLLDAWMVEPYWLQVTRVRLTSPKIPRGAAPIRIVHLSDLHCDPRVRLEEQLPDAVAEEKPDLIVFTGDALNHRDGLPAFRRCMTRLAAIAPTYAVKGNWDVNYWRALDLFGGTGVRELTGERVMLSVHGAPLCLGGAPVWEGWWGQSLFRGVDPAAYTLFLYHMPGGIIHAARGGVDLVLTGHTHGGQVRLPFYGALITLSELGKRYEAGLYRVQNSWLYVNRGIGMEGGIAPRWRFNDRPELTVIEIAPAE